MKLCECGCGEMYRQRSHNSKYKPGHFVGEIAKKARAERKARYAESLAISETARKEQDKAKLLRDPAGALKCEHRRGPSCGHSDPPLSISKCGCLQIRARGLCPAGFVVGRRWEGYLP